MFNLLTLRIGFLFFIPWVCRNRDRKAKAHLEFNLDVKGFFTYFISKSKTRENVGLLQNGAGHLVTMDMEKAEVFSATFSLVFTTWVLLRSPRPPETRMESWSRKTYPWWQGSNQGMCRHNGRPQVQGTWWDALMSVEGGGWCLCKAILNHLWKILVNGRGSWGLEKFSRPGLNLEDVLLIVVSKNEA